jgi:hypothetical protein
MTIRNGLYSITTKLLDGATAKCLEAARCFIILEAISVQEANGKVK